MSRQRNTLAPMSNLASEVSLAKDFGKSGVN